MSRLEVKAYHAPPRDEDGHLGFSRLPIRLGRTARIAIESWAYRWPKGCTSAAARRCSDDHVPVRRTTHAGQVPYLRGAAVCVPGHDSPALEVLSLRPLALARPVDDARGP